VVLRGYLLGINKPWALSKLSPFRPKTGHNLYGKKDGGTMGCLGCLGNIILYCLAICIGLMLVRDLFLFAASKSWKEFWRKEVIRRLFFDFTQEDSQKVFLRAALIAAMLGNRESDSDQGRDERFNDGTLKLPRSLHGGSPWT
jgi:hypothetical protein